MIFHVVWLGSIKRIYAYTSCFSVIADWGNLPDNLQFVHNGPSGIARNIISIARFTLPIIYHRQTSLLLRAGELHPNPGPSLHVAQFNVLGFSPGKKISLLHKAKMLALDVVLLQELHVTEDEASRLAIPGFHCFAVARHAKGGGIAVFVRDALQCSLTSQSVSEVVEHTTVCVKVGDEFSYFTSAYFPRGHKVSAAALSRLSQDDRRTHIIEADTNCHHEDWDRYVAPNPGGTYVVDFCIDQAYTILNTGEPTRRSLTIQRGQLSAPDVTLARGCIGRRWQAKPDPDSDHFFITFDIVIGDAEPLGSQVPKRSYYSWDRADWKEFRRRVTEDCKEFPKKGTPDQQAKFLSRSIAKATAEVVPKGASHIPISWSAALEDATRKCERLLSPLEGATPTQRRQLLAATQERKNLLDVHCKEWGKMCADMKPANSTTWRTLQNIVSARPTPTNLVVEGGREVPLTTAANHLVSFFKKKAVKHPEAKEPQATPRPTSMFRAITRQELVDALRYIKCHRACGPDDVYNEALLQLPRAARTALLRTFNRSLSRGIVPHEWKRGTIVPFLKPGKPAGKVESYRPITLTSTIAKLMERIIHGRLRHLVTSENQAGFRAGMSATDVLMWLRAQVQPTSASKTPRTSAVFVDFSRAFDSVDHDLLLQRLQKLNVDPHLARWTLNFLTDRQVRVRMGHRHCSRTEVFTCGVPQGTVLGPLLFNIFMEDLSADLNRSGALHYFYADDLTIVARGRDRELVLNQALDMLSHWSRTHFMDVNVGKTNVCHFRSRRDAPVLRYRGQPVQQYLFVTHHLQRNAITEARAIVAAFIAAREASLRERSTTSLAVSILHGTDGSQRGSMGVNDVAAVLLVSLHEWFEGRAGNSKSLLNALLFSMKISSSTMRLVVLKERLALCFALDRCVGDFTAVVHKYIESVDRSPGARLAPRSGELGFSFHQFFHLPSPMKERARVLDAVFRWIDSVEAICESEVANIRVQFLQALRGVAESASVSVPVALFGGRIAHYLVNIHTLPVPRMKHE
ncbi:Tbingi protein [Perkinsela sp. CCAP 1560/4]|nr:Tbingi protein [Perkinsela sp. CCAP 1560/4]|eukprot:KNH07224.1 Tbingi protein [Perkinsela sp. CCAP 1560/4]